MVAEMPLQYFRTLQRLLEVFAKLSRRTADHRRSSFTLADEVLAHLPLQPSHGTYARSPFVATLGCSLHASLCRVPAPLEPRWILLLVGLAPFTPALVVHSYQIPCGVIYSSEIRHGECGA